MSDGDALLAAIRLNPLELTPQLLYRDWAQENPDVIQGLIGSAMRYCNILTVTGIGVSHPKRGAAREERRDYFARERDQLLSCPDAFAASMAYLATRGKRKTPDKSSYHFKHEVERLWDDTEWHVYVANGVFIAAAICSGFEWKRDGMGVNANMCISRRAPRIRQTANGVPA